MSRKRKRENEDDVQASKCPRTKTRSPGDLRKPNFEPPRTLLYYYQHVLPLREFLLARLPPTSRIRSKRLRSYPSSLLDDHVVGVLEDPSNDVQETRKREFITFTQSQYSASRASGTASNVSMNEIVDFVVWLLFQKSSPSLSRPHHILCHGLQRATASSDSIDGQIYLPGIVRQHPNNNFDDLKSPAWAHLPGLLGESAEQILMTLLLDIAMFVRLPTGRDNYYQISGTPLALLSKFQPGRNITVTTESRSQSCSKVRTPEQITFVRSRILYARPSLNCSRNVSLGLQHIHAFNRYPDQYSILDRVFLLKYIFPRQFKLHNVFTSEVDTKETAQSFKDYTLREHEIKNQRTCSGISMPRRVRGPIQALISMIQARHKQCAYVQLLRHFCPISRQPDTTILTNQISVSSVASSTFAQLRSQGSHQPSLSTPQNHAEKVAKSSEDCMMVYATPAEQVSAFCRSVIRHVLPTDTFGHGFEGVQNFARLLRAVDAFVKMRRHESMTLCEVIHEIRVSAIEWLRPPGITSTTKMALTDHAKRKELFHEFLYYLFDSVIIPLIRSNFYVTESGVNRNKLFYFRHDVWRKLSEPSLAILRTRIFSPISDRELRSTQGSRTLGYSQLRLLPKDSGARPIMNLRRKPIKVVGGKRVLGASINAQLLPIFSVLKYEGTRKQEVVGSAMLSVGDIHHRLLAFQAKLRCAKQFLYFVKVDVKSCFDTIPQKQLSRLVARLLSQKQYRTTRALAVKTNSRSSTLQEQQVSRRFIGVAQAADGHSVFSDLAAAELAEKKKRLVFADTGNHRTWQAAKVLKLLREHIQNNVVKIGKKHFRQKDGIPQGSILSSLLCTMFYTDFQKTHLGFLNDQTSLLLRLIDDFLLITTDKEHAKQFVSVMAEGTAEYGITIRPEKSLANFEMSINGHKLPRHQSGSWFPYCGLHINMASLAVGKDRDKKDFWVGNSLTVDSGSKAVGMFHRRIATTLKLQLQATLLDQRLNGRQQVMSSILGCFMETAMKMHRYVMSMSRHKSIDDKTIITSIESMIDICARMTNQRYNPQQQKTKSISKAHICWLASTAMIRVLHRKQSRYRNVLTWLRELNMDYASSMRLDGMRVSKMINDNVRSFEQHVY